MRQKLLTTFALLLMAVSGAWALNPRSGDEWVEGTKTLTVNSDPDNHYRSNDEIVHLIIGDDVTSIGEEAFMDNTSLVSINMPDVITKISVRAFKNCTNLSEINSLPNNLVIIEEEAFSGTNLTEITIPDGVTSIGERAFANCSNLTSVTIPTSETYVAENAFEGCDGLIIYVPEDEVFNCRNRWPAYAEIIYAEGTIPYIAADGSQAYCTDYTVLNGSETSLGAGWYVVNSNVSYPQGLTFNGGEGDVNLILCDGAEMSIEVGKELLIAMQVNGNSFNIYGQSGGTGKLTTSTDNYHGIYAVSCDMTINGGTISASGGDDGDGIYAESCALTINGGTIDANGGFDGISSGAITISSGTVNATGGYDNGIYAYQDLIINGGTIEAHGISDGIYCNEGNITISGGNVTADCTANNSSGIFCLEGDITISGGSVYATGKKAGIDADNNLIISDGYIEATGNDYGILASLDITISGGHVIADGNGIGLYCYGGGITISGGIIDANSKNTCIFASSEIVISGGSVDATGGSCGISNREGNITISGGSVTADGSDGISLVDGNVYLGWVNASDRIAVSSFVLGGNIYIADGQSFYNGEIIIPSGKVDNRSKLEGKTLTPYVTLAAKQVTVDGQTDYWTTFYCGDTGFSFDAEENACAYTATVSGGTITLHKLGRVIPKNTAVIIVGTDESINMTVSEATAENTVDNHLHGVDVATALDDVKSTYSADAILVLSNKNSHFGFHDLATTNVPARKAFLALSGETAKARQFMMVFDDATGIHSIDNGQLIMDNEADAWYSLDGRRLSGKPTQKGLYIHNGNKVLVK